MDDVARALDLAGLPGGGPPPEILATDALREPGELWAYRAGRKPVVFLTLREADVDRALAWFPDAHVERRDRRVHVEPGDVWVDDRERGEPRVELYISRDAALAREACALQSEGDPSRATLRLGELLGYPKCCAAAFHAQRDRSDNTKNRYETAARTEVHPWRFELDNLVVMLVPFFPCTYVCPRAADLVRATLAAIRAEDPVAADRTEALLRRPILYFGHDTFIAFDGRSPEPGVIDYTRALVPPRATSSTTRLATALSQGNRLHVDRTALRVVHAGATCVEIPRTDPRLGFVAPFA